MPTATEMLAAIGVDSIEDLFADVPAELRLPDGLDELDAGPLRAGGL